MARRSGLGRGLGALIPADVAGDGAGALVEIPVGSITANPYQPRKHFDEEALAGLAESIAALGVLQPLLVRAREDGTYELVAGERRLRAARRAGLQTVPAVVRTVSDTASLEQALVENLHRQDLGPLEEAAAYQQLIEDFGLTHEQVAQRVGKSRAAVSNSLRLFQLPTAIQRMVAEDQLSAGHARALLGTPDRAFQEALARRAVAEGLSVRAVEDAVRTRAELAGRLAGGRPDAAEGEGGGAADGSPSGATGARSGSALRPPGLLELEELLSEHLQTRVSVELGGRRGKVVVEFATLEDLERIYRLMTEAPAPDEG